MYMYFKFSIRIPEWLRILKVLNLVQSLTSKKQVSNKGKPFNTGTIGYAENHITNTGTQVSHSIMRADDKVLGARLLGHTQYTAAERDDG